MKIIMALLILVSSLESVVAAEDAEPITQDFSRSFLAEYGAKLVEPESRGAGPVLKMPEGAQAQYTYGIDVSHHNFDSGSTIAWAELPGNQVAFVYMKATEGDHFFDGTLEANWKAISKDAGTLLKGPYHFLSANVDPEKQAANFISILRTKTNYVSGKDLPPCLDLEWDLAKDQKGDLVDRWKSLSPDQIMQKVDAWLRSVEKEFPVRAIIYTNAAWWKSVGLTDDKFLADRNIWIADYTVKANSTSLPTVPPNRRWLVWQFTENLELGGKKFDGNVSKRDHFGFAKELGLKISQ